MEGVHQPLSDEVLSKLREIVAWLERDARDQFKDLDHFEEMLESISQELPEDVRASLVSICSLDILYAPIRHALRKLRSRPATCLVLKKIARNCWTASAKQHPMLVV
jgi:hypothetical protein